MNILLNINNFSEPWAYDELSEIIKPNMKVLIVPWSYHEDFITNAADFDREFGKGGPQYEEIAREFMNYGIKRRNIRVLHYYKDSRRMMRMKFFFADIVFFTGGYPDKFLYRIDKKNIRPFIEKFKGIYMGTSAGAMIQFDHYHVTPEEEGQDYDYQDGLGLLSGFDIEVHYEEDFPHIASLLIDLQLHDTPIFALPNTGGMIVEDDDYMLLGDAFLIVPEDIPELQEVMDEIVQETSDMQ